ncbi:hypothetical protein A5674_27070 [Mycobacterium malmoense]|nr:hypothetical protein A5674_27070 [Mycobacterium malmoense]
MLKRCANDVDAEKRLRNEIARNPGIVHAAWEPRYDAANGHSVWAHDWGAWTWAFRQAGFHQGKGYQLIDGVAIMDSKPAEPPEGPIHLWRGCPPERRFGMSWTSNYDLALKFAKADGAGRRHAGCIFGHWAWGSEMLAHTHRETWCKPEPGQAASPWVPQRSDGSVLSEYDEYVLNSACLDDANVRLLEVHPSLYGEMVWRYSQAGYPTNFDLLPIE